MTSYLNDSQSCPLLLYNLPCIVVAAFRFHGLKVPIGGNGLWFYSVQGLFRVAFEMYSKQEQLAVLGSFQVQYSSHQLASKG